MDELEHVVNCLVAMREAEEAKLKEFGFTWKTLQAAKDRVADAIPNDGIDKGKYLVVIEERKSWIAPANGVQMKSRKSIHIHEKRG